MDTTGPGELVFRRLVALTFLAVASNGVASDTYLLMDGLMAPLEKKQPTFVAFFRGLRIVHFPVNRSIHPANPGRYKLDHIDFDLHPDSEQRTVNWPNGNVIFDVVPNAINFVGIAHLDRVHRSVYKAKLNSSETLIQWACAENPQVFSRLPVVVAWPPDTGKRYKVVCQTSPEDKSLINE